MTVRTILHMANHCDIGGNVHLAVDLACAQAARGLDVLFASGGGRCEALLAEHGVRHVRLDQCLRHPWRLGGAVLALRNLCRAERPQVIHAHMMSAAVVAWAARPWHRAPIVATVHNSFDTHATFMRLADVVVAVSRSERALLVERGFAPDRVRVVTNGTIGSARTSRACADDLSVPRPRVVTMSGLEPRKGVGDVIDAFARVAGAAPGWHLVIAGEGPERAALEAQAGGCAAADRIHFTGHVEEPRALLRQTDVFVLASHAEPFGLGILEARQVGCAVVGSRVGGIADQLGDDRYGLTVPPARPDLLAATLARLMTDPAELARARRVAGEDLGVYSVERMEADYSEVYAEAAAARSRGFRRVGDRALPSGGDKGGRRVPR